jgi:peptidoglycan hydrolase CwlO-like protein
MITRTHAIRSAARALLPAGLIAAAALVVPGVASSSSPSDLQSRIAAAAGRESALQRSLSADRQRAAGYQGRIDDLRQQLAGFESSLAIERAQLVTIKGELRDARAHLLRLRIRLAADRKLLAAQLVGDYETDRPDLITVVMDAHGFADLLERADALKVVARHDADVTGRVRDAQHAVATQAAQLSRVEIHQQQITSATSVQAAEVAQLKVAVVSEQMRFVSAANRKSVQLASLRTQRATLEHRLAVAQAAAVPPSVSSGTSIPVSGGGSFAGHGGSYGFFPAPGTNYSVGEEPTIAARLDQLGKALQLHLIGISGYRSPQHSVEVGGFANDPHTRGQASDTPGIEGVAEATLERFGLTRPFPGAAEADHIQLLGG